MILKPQSFSKDSTILYLSRVRVVVGVALLGGGALLRHHQRKSLGSSAALLTSLSQPQRWHHVLVSFSPSNRGWSPHPPHSSHRKAIVSFYAFE